MFEQILRYHKDISKGAILKRCPKALNINFKHFSENPEVV
jgi:hypothetical protein